MSTRLTISRKTLHGELVTLLRNMIIEGELRPGARIAESHMCTQFGVSRTPLREALKVLSAEGLICLLPNKGATVVRVTRKELAEILPVLGSLAALAGELVCATASADQIARIKNIYLEMVGHYRMGASQAYAECNNALHEAIFETANNRTLCDAYTMIEMRLRSLLFVTPKAPPKWAEAIEDHEQMMAALEARDGVRFAAIARQHVRHRGDVMTIAIDMLEATVDDDYSCAIQTVA